jgi:hypothetical protein
MFSSEEKLFIEFHFSWKDWSKGMKEAEIVSTREKNKAIVICYEVEKNIGKYREKCETKYSYSDKIWP